MIDINTLYEMLNQEQEQFKDFQASSLYCPKCRKAQKVNKRLLLILPDGDLYEYRCSVCNESLGRQKDTVPPKNIIT